MIFRRGCFGLRRSALNFAAIFWASCWPFKQSCPRVKCLFYALFRPISPEKTERHGNRSVGELTINPPNTEALTVRQAVLLRRKDENRNATKKDAWLKKTKEQIHRAQASCCKKASTNHQTSRANTTAWEICQRGHWDRLVRCNPPFTVPQNA